MKFPKVNKYHAVRTHGFDSKGERERYQELEILQKAGVISELKDHPRLELERGIFYKPDYSYTQKGVKIYEDFKGVEGERFRLIKKIWKLHGPGILRITKRDRTLGRFVTVQEIKPR